MYAIIKRIVHCACVVGVFWRVWRKLATVNFMTGDTEMDFKLWNLGVWDLDCWIVHSSSEQLYRLRRTMRRTCSHWYLTFISKKKIPGRFPTSLLKPYKGGANSLSPTARVKAGSSMQPLCGRSIGRDCCTKVTLCRPWYQTRRCPGLRWIYFAVL